MVDRFNGIYADGKLTERGYKLGYSTSSEIILNGDYITSIIKYEEGSRNRVYHWLLTIYDQSYNVLREDKFLTLEDATFWEKLLLTECAKWYFKERNDE